MNFNIQGLHHVTATVNDAQEDYDFYTKLLGLRLVKKTVNFDNNQVYHFYYGNEIGEPGTIFTTFPYKNQNVRIGEKGTGQVAITNLSVPSASTEYWRSRFDQRQIEFLSYDFFGSPTFKFNDPSGLELQLIFNDEDQREPWDGGSIPAEHMIRGLHSVVLSIADVKKDLPFIQDTFGFKKVEEQSNYAKYESSAGGVGNMLFLREDAHLSKGKNGIGTVHHVAWRIADREKLDDLRQYLSNDLGYKPTEIKDRKYFNSVYFRIPGGVLFEIATVGPGFDVDESREELGRHLMLPEWEEANRAEIESALSAIG
jgi:glyoxalase family protein